MNRLLDPIRGFDGAGMRGRGDSADFGLGCGTDTSVPLGDRRARPFQFSFVSRASANGVPCPAMAAR